MRYLAASAGTENDKVLDWLFRVEKRNKHARVSATRQGPSLKKNGGNFVDHIDKKLLPFNVLS